MDSSMRERPKAGIEDTVKRQDPPASESRSGIDPWAGVTMTPKRSSGGKRLAGKLHEPFE